ncbi:hypothetical protein shn_07020 [Shinella sp. HZN7]|nr:hypothetical protein shn_07020 [Shinella sp. HZN7]
MRLQLLQRTLGELEMLDIVPCSISAMTFRNVGGNRGRRPAYLRYHSINLFTGKPPRQFIAFDR